MADMEHLFREQEMRELEMATGRPTANEIFKTALYRAEQAQYNMRKKRNTICVKRLLRRKPRKL